ncbi:MAG: transglycosylase domain-containing protein [Christensenellaceae bacterium]|jgi:penicillin-binding protein 1A|nr:transglycosylase domain-containing protein [Christensenellaceae bacterium]
MEFIDPNQPHPSDAPPENAPKASKDKLKAAAAGVSGAVSSFGKAANKLFARTRRKAVRLIHARGREEQDLFIERYKERPFVLAVLFTTLRTFVLAVVLLGCAGMGLMMGVAKAYIDTTPDLDTSQITKSDRTSYIYDKDGALITTFAGMEYRDWANIDEIPDMLKNALVSIEDVRFFKHGGVDYKRLFSAVINTLRNTDTHGGSTLTQQLIKNKVLSNEQSYKRKIKEAYLSIELETIFSKDQILEAYMNDIPLGGSNYGFKTAAKDYFDKEMRELSIRECAMLAGIVQKPYNTNPRLNTYSRTLDAKGAAELNNLYESGGITRAQYLYSLEGNNQMYVTDRRTNVVLLAMYEGGFITKTQYESALEDTVSITEVSANSKLYDMPYFVEYGIRDVTLHLMAQRGMLDTPANRKTIESELRTGGYHIYLTVDTAMQHQVQTTITEWDKYPSLINPSAGVYTYTNADGTTTDIIQPQAAAVIIDNQTGELRVIIGGREEPTVKKGLNRAWQSGLQVGSSIKPLAVYGPALDLGASPATILKNFPAPIDGWDSPKGYPAVGSEKYIGPLTLRTGVVQSLNVAAARTLLEHVTIPKGIEYLAALGVDPSRLSATGSGLALGTTDITPIEMAAAFATIASGGEYVEPLSFSRVVDDNGRVILDAETVRGRHTVFKPSTAYMLTDILTDAVNHGTGTKAKISGITVAGKTGTNSDYSSVCFSGFTGYYTATLWIGHDYYSQEQYHLKGKPTGGSYAAPLWQSFMSKIHSGLPDKPIIDASPTDLGLEKCTVCSVSGLLATDACYADSAGHTPVTDWFLKETKPLIFCDMHEVASICTESGQPASAYCPSITAGGSIVRIFADSPYAAIDHQLLLQYIPNAVFLNITTEEYDEASGSIESGAKCTLHTPAWMQQGGSDADLTAAREGAQALISQINDYFANVQTLPETERTVLQEGVHELQSYISYGTASAITRETEELRYTYQAMQQAYPPVGAY